ncbi:MAG: response regulator [Planctomycetota bacterium]|nr:MAG: response regulator [Planctomycetota bacterium]REK27691.1 MAG: response regulator [Planctomycetota bacterium]REK38466.1 MAG: response regulator [Planctomycetota bacterium]
MSQSTYFLQECPTCGRNLRIRIAYLGRQVVCQHCNANFEACDPASAAYPPDKSGLAILKRADELLSTVEQQARSRPR